MGVPKVFDLLIEKEELNSKVILAGGLNCTMYLWQLKG